MPKCLRGSGDGLMLASSKPEIKRGNRLSDVGGLNSRPSQVKNRSGAFFGLSALVRLLT